MHASELTLDSGTSGTASHTSRHDMLTIISSRYQYDPFLFFVAEVMSNYLTTDGLKKFSLLPEAPLRPEAGGICHICHMVNPALIGAATPGELPGELHINNIITHENTAR